MKKFSLAAAVLLLCSAFAGAEPDLQQKLAEDPQYFKLDNSSVIRETLPVPEQLRSKGIGAPEAASAVTKGGISISEVSMGLDTADQIVNIASKVWDLINHNQPVSKVPNKMPYATAIPKGLDTWTVMTGWQGPFSLLKHFAVKNVYGVKVADVQYLVSYTHHGVYKGKGQYLTGVTAEPVSVKIAWGWTLKMKASVDDSTVINIGTVSRPKAALRLVVNYSVSSMLNHVEYTDSYIIQGDGRYKEEENHAETQGMDAGY